MIELIGTIGSIIILISFTFNSETKIRELNAIASIIFIIYGTFIQSFTIVSLNILLFILQAYKIIKLNHRNKR